MHASWLASAPVDKMTPENEYFDARETRSSDARTSQQLISLRNLLERARTQSTAIAKTLGHRDVTDISDLSALESAFPITRKSDLLARQRENIQQEPFGGFSTLVTGPHMPRLFASPGPIYEPQGKATDYWRMARALHAAKIKAKDLVHNAFSYHMTPGAFMFETGAHALGCTVFPAGTGQTEQQLQAMQELRPNVYCGTPSFLRILLENAKTANIALPSLRTASVSGEACPASHVKWFAKEHGVNVFQTYATADLGLIAYETSAREGYVLDEDVIVEIVEPGGTQPLPFGEVGEVIVTVLNPSYPLIRFSTGDLSSFIPGPCPTGRTSPRIKGWQGRADPSIKVRGMFVHRSSLDQLKRRIPEVLQCRITVRHVNAQDHITLSVESLDGDSGFKQSVESAFREITKLGAEVVLISAGMLPGDGKVIVDERVFR